jgi:hypothetical protein
MPACKKHETVKEVNEKPQLPPDPQEAAPVSGVTQPETPNGNIVYRKVNMVVGYNKQISLDVDADGVSDFNFFGQLIYHNEKPHLYLLVTPKTIKGSSVMVQNGEELVINALWSFPLEKETVVRENPVSGCIWTEPLMKAFITGSSKTPTSEEYSGLWIGKEQKYMGIRFKLDGKFHYGWVKLSHDKLKDEVTINDYAYSKLPEQGIAAGKTE